MNPNTPQFVARTLRHFVGWLGLIVPILASQPQVGDLMTKTFSELNSGGSRAWNAITEDRWGRMYVSVDHQVLSSQGGRWLPLPKRPSSGRPVELFIDALDRLWVGASGDTGYYQLSPRETPQWVSVHDQLDTPDGQDRWRPRWFDAETGTMYLAGYRSVITWNPESDQQSWDVAAGTFAIVNIGGDLVAISNFPHFDRLLPDGTVERLFRNPGGQVVSTVYATLNLDADTLLIGTDQGAFQLQNGKIRPWPIRDENDQISPIAVRTIARNSNGEILILSQRRNILRTVDPSGRIQHARQVKTGLVRVPP